METENKDIVKVVIFLILAFTLVNLFVSYNLYNKFSSVSDVLTGKSNNQNQETGTQNNEQQPSNVQVSDDGDPSIGSPNAPVTMITFSDFECPFCARFPQGALPQIESEYIKTGKVRLVFRDFPLPFHENAKKAAEAAECANEQGRFWEYHDKLFANQSALTVNDLKKYATELGLDAGKFNSCLDSGKMTAEVEKDLADGTTAGVDGTPTFFVNGTKVVGALPFESFKQAIDAALTK